MQDLTTQNWVFIGIAVALVIVVIAAVWYALARKRTERLRAHFGDEYEKVVSDYGDRTRAERDLADRQKRLSQLQIRPLTAQEQDQFHQDWQNVQARFVDQPPQALSEADRLVTHVLRARGYPTDNFNDRLDAVSAAYPGAIGSYRSACEIMSRQGRVNLTTEDMRLAMVQYRRLFEELFKDTAERRPLRRVS
jgi:hypothetical protein